MVICGCIDTVFTGQPLPVFSQWVADGDGARCKACLDESAGQAGGHIAAADKSQIGVAQNKSPVDGWFGLLLSRWFFCTLLTQPKNISTYPDQC